MVVEVETLVNTVEMVMVLAAVLVVVLATLVLMAAQEIHPQHPLHREITAVTPPQTVLTTKALAVVVQVV